MRVEEYCASGRRDGRIEVSVKEGSDELIWVDEG